MRTVYLLGSRGLPLLMALTLGCTAHTQSPGVSTLPNEALAPSVDAMAQQAAPAAQRIAPIYESATTEEDGHTDWNIPLQTGQCYLFAGVGGSGVKHLYLYLWAPGENRVATEKPERPEVTLRYCPTEAGLFHLQAKTGEGHGAFAIGVYAEAAGQPAGQPATAAPLPPYVPPGTYVPPPSYAPPPAYAPPGAYAPPPTYVPPPPYAPPGAYAPPPSYTPPPAAAPPPHIIPR